MVPLLSAMKIHPKSESSIRRYLNCCRQVTVLSLLYRYLPTTWRMMNMGFGSARTRREEQESSFEPKSPRVSNGKKSRHRMQFRILTANDRVRADHRGHWTGPFTWRQRITRRKEGHKQQVRQDRGWSGGTDRVGRSTAWHRGNE